MAAVAADHVHLSSHHYHLGAPLSQSIGCLHELSEFCHPNLVSYSKALQRNSLIEEAAMAKHEEILKQLNRSGYPFQLRVEQEVIATSQDHWWLLAGREQPWSISDGGSGFIDIVLAHSHFTTYRLVLECKRVKADDERQLNWIFPIPGAASQTTLSSCLEVEGKGDRTTSPPAWTDMRIWDDVRVSPGSYQAEICVLPSDEQRRSPILESLAVECIQSVSGLANEEINVMSKGYAQHLRLFIIPVIVTNADLAVCRFDPNSIKIEDGTLDASSTEIEIVPFIRFRKSLATSIPQISFDDLKAANRARERTVFVVTAACLAEFLKSWKIEALDRFNGFAIERRGRHII